MKVTALKCLSCHSIVFSRARHDMRSCKCGNIAIDGGFDYRKVAIMHPDAGFEAVDLDINATTKDLYDDWNKHRNEYGLIVISDE